MNGYCDRCENHCPADAPRCERGYRGFDEVEGRHGEPGGFHTLPARPHPHMGGRRGHDDPGFDGGRGRGPGFGGGRGGFGGGPGGFGGGRPPFDGRPPRPMPDADMLLERIGEADLEELLMMAGRMMPRRPGAGSARGQSLILSILAGREALDQRELQQMLGVQPGSMSEIVSKLERKGMVTREKGEDRRGNRLRITEAGRAALPEADGDAEDALFSALTQAQRDALARMLRTLLSDWASKLPAGPRGREGRFETLPARPGAPEGFATLEERHPDEGHGVKI